MALSNCDIPYCLDDISGFYILGTSVSAGVTRCTIPEFRRGDARLFHTQQRLPDDTTDEIISPRSCRTASTTGTALVAALDVRPTSVFDHFYEGPVRNINIDGMFLMGCCQRWAPTFQPSVFIFISIAEWPLVLRTLISCKSTNPVPRLQRSSNG